MPMMFSPSTPPTGESLPDLEMDSASISSGDSGSSPSSRRRWMGIFSSHITLDFTEQSVSLTSIMAVLASVRDHHDETVVHAARCLADLLDIPTDLLSAEKHGVVEVAASALSAAVGDHRCTEVMSALLSVVCHLSSGDDDGALRRARSFVGCGAVELLGTLIRMYCNCTDGNQAADFELMRLCVCALQQLCRRAPVASAKASAKAAPTASPWLGRLLHSSGVDALSAVVRVASHERRLITCTAFLCATVARELTLPPCTDVNTGAPPVADALRTAEQAALVRAMTTVVSLPPLEHEPADGTEVHQAAALVLSELCVSPALAALMARHETIRDLCTAMNAPTATSAMRANTCVLLCCLCDNGASASSVLERSGLIEACNGALHDEAMRALLGRGPLKELEAVLARLDQGGSGLRQVL